MPSIFDRPTVAVLIDIDAPLFLRFVRAGMRVQALNGEANTAFVLSETGPEGERANYDALARELGSREIPAALAELEAAEGAYKSHVSKKMRAAISRLVLLAVRELKARGED